jgi:hypothetical protein
MSSSVSANVLSSSVYVLHKCLDVDISIDVIDRNFAEDVVLGLKTSLGPPKSAITLAIQNLFRGLVTQGRRGRDMIFQQSLRREPPITLRTGRCLLVRIKDLASPFLDAGPYQGLESIRSLNMSTTLIYEHGVDLGAVSRRDNGQFGAHDEGNTLGRTTKKT